MRTRSGPRTGWWTSAPAPVSTAAGRGFRAVDDLLASTESLTGAYLTGRQQIPLPAARRKRSKSREVVVQGGQ